LQSLLSVLEGCVSKQTKIAVNMFDIILNDVLKSTEVASLSVGCHAHSFSLTAKCIYFYVVTRIHFINRACNKRRVSRLQKQKHSKLSKLT
jgi:hypothetical protein